MGKLKKVTGIIRQDTGVGYYRIGQPNLFINRVVERTCRNTPFYGMNEIRSIGETGANAPAWNDKLLMSIAKDADILWSTILYDYDEIVKMLDLRKWSGAKWVVDIDDNIYAVTSDNPAQKNAKILKENFELCMKLADGVTVSVPSLKALYSHLNDNIYINYNGFDDEWWGEVRPKKKSKHKGFRIGWRGAYGHRADVQLIEPVINKLKENYPVEFVTLGVEPPFSSEHHKWVPFLKYPEKLASLELDMGVVPLIDSNYNRCKSNIGVQEFAGLKIPVVCSPTENQKDLPTRFANTNYEWYEQIETLIKDKELRAKEGNELYKATIEKYGMEKLTKPLIEWFEKLPRKDIEPIKMPKKRTKTAKKRKK